MKQYAVYINFGHCKVYGMEYGRHFRCKGCSEGEDINGIGTCKKDHCARCGADMKPKRRK